jgi:hypothetical protein
MRSDPLSPLRILEALELFGPQARPYNFDDHFDCWGLVQKVFDWVDDGFDVDEEAEGEAAGSDWRPFRDRDELVPGDLLATHSKPDPEYHVAFFCGSVGDLDLVYDSSSRGAVPLLDDSLALVSERLIHTRYARATETTDRLRDDGGGYLRLWHERMRWLHGGLHDRLLKAGAAGEHDLPTLRRRAGLSDLPFYCRRRLPRDGRGREVYDNLATRHLDYYVPDGAPVPDDLYEDAAGPAGAAARPAAPVIVEAPAWDTRRGPLQVSWAYRPGDRVTGCRIEVWEETWDLWRRRLSRIDAEGPVSSFVVPEDGLLPGGRYAAVLFARGPAGFSGSAVAPFLYKPAGDDRLLEYNPVRPTGLRPDGGAIVPAATPSELAWSIPSPAEHQVAAELAVYEDAGCLADGHRPVFSARLKGPQASSSRCPLPPGVLRAGHTYYWYVTPRNARGFAAFAPAEGVFTVDQKE